MPTPNPTLSHLNYPPDAKLYNLGCEPHKEDAGADPVSLTGDLRPVGLDGEGHRTPPRVGGRVGGSIFWIPLLSRIVVSQQRDVIAFVAQNWKIVLILMIPLFYQTVRTFLEEVQEAWGIKRTPKQALQSEPSVTSHTHASAEPTFAPEEE